MDNKLINKAVDLISKMTLEEIWVRELTPVSDIHSSFTTESGEILIIPNKYGVEFSSIENDLYDNKNLKKGRIDEKFSKNTIIDILNRVIELHFINLKNNNSDNDLKKNLNQAFLKGNKYYHIFALGQVILSSSKKVRFEDIEIIQLTNSNFKSLIKRGVIKNPNDFKKIWSKQYGKDFNSIVIAVVKNSSSDIVLAYSQAKYKLQLSLDRLNIFVYFFNNYNHQLSVTSKIIIRNQKEYLFYKNCSYTVKNDNNNNSPIFKLNYNDNDCDLSDVFKSDKLKPLISNYQKLFTNHNNSDFKKFQSFLRWCGLGIWQESQDQALLNLITALESYLVPGKESLKFKLSLIISKLLGKDKRAKNNISKTIKDVYDLRSSIVHDGLHDHKFHQIGDIKYICILILHSTLKGKSILKRGIKNNDLGVRLNQLLLN
jgi:hypothetical protein